MSPHPGTPLGGRGSCIVITQCHEFEAMAGIAEVPAHDDDAYDMTDDGGR